MTDLTSIILGKRSHQQFIDQVNSWHDEVVNLVLKEKPELAEELRFYTHAPLELLSAKSRLEMIGKYRDVIGFDEALRSLSHTQGSTNITNNVEKVLTGEGRLGTKLGQQSQDKVRNIMSNLHMLASDDSAYGKLTQGITDPVIKQIYEGLNIQFRDYFSPISAGIDADPSLVDPTRYLGFGQKSIRRPRTTGILKPQKGKTYTLYDIETAGLMKGQIREIAYSTGIVGQTAGSNPEVIISRAPAMSGARIGYKDDTGQYLSRTLEEHLQATGGSNFSNILNMKTDGIVDDFTDRIEPFLKQLEANDYIVGHNINFDIEQLFGQLRKSSQYMNNVNGYKTRINSLFDQIKSGDKVVDTLQLVQSNPNLSKLGVAKEFIQRNELKQFGIENLLLETDLIDHLKQGTESRADTMARLMKGPGLHSANIDVSVTEALMHNYEKLKIVSGTADEIVDEEFRRFVVSSAALTPSTLANVEQLSDKTIRTILSAEGYSGIRDDLQSKNFIEPIKEQLRQGQITETEAVRMLREQSATSKVNPFRISMREQSILEGRDFSISQNITTNVEDTIQDIARSMGDFNRLTYNGRASLGRALKENAYQDMINYGQFVSGTDYGRFQSKMAGLGMPWAGLSYEERRFGSIVSQITSSLSTDRIAPISHELLLSHFKDFGIGDKIQYYPRYAEHGSARLTLPTAALEKAGVLEQGTALRPSIVGKTIRREERSVNLLVDMSKKQAENLSQQIIGLVEQPDRGGIARFLFGAGDEAELISKVSDYRGIAFEGTEEEYTKTISNVESAFRQSFEPLQGQLDQIRIKESDLNDLMSRQATLTPAEQTTMQDLVSEVQRLRTELHAGVADKLQRGVAVAQVDGKQAEGFIQALADFSGQGADDITDKSMINVGFHYAGTSNTGDGAIIRTAGVTASIGRDQKVTQAIGKQVDTTLTMAKDIEEQTVKNPALGEFMRRMSNAESDKSARVMTNVADFFTKNSKSIKVGGLSVIAGSIAFSMYNKHRKNRQYNEPFEKMPVQNVAKYGVADQLQIKQQMGINKYYQRYDPLATANVVGDLYNSRIGHTNMSYNRNNNLYGGVL